MLGGRLQKWFKNVLWNDTSANYKQLIEKSITIYRKSWRPDGFEIPFHCSDLYFFSENTMALVKSMANDFTKIYQIWKDNIKEKLMVSWWVNIWMIFAICFQMFIFYILVHVNIAYRHCENDPVVEHWLDREIAQWVHHKGSIRRPIAPWANALTRELHLAPTRCNAISTLVRYNYGLR